MKLKYLLPAATIASAAAIVTPLVTSCAHSEKWDYDWKAKGEYEAKCAQAVSAAPLSPDDTLKLYLEDIKKDGAVLEDDLLYNLNGTYNHIMDPSTQDDLYKLKASADFLKVDAEKNTLSFKFKVTLKSKMYMFGENSGDECYVEQYANLTVKNLKYSAIYNGDDNEGLNLNWLIQPSYSTLDTPEQQIAYLKADKDWKLSGECKQVFQVPTQPDLDEKFHKTKSYNWSNFEKDFRSEEMTVFTALAQHLFFESYHLDLVEKN